jgi:hypothetical protein
MNTLTIIYAPNQDALLPFKDNATHWLPEQLKHTLNIYQPPNIICTTKDTVLNLLEELIISGQLNYEQVIYVKAAEHPAIFYTFNELGKFKDFYFYHSLLLRQGS